MAQDDLQTGIFIEDTGQDQTHELDTGLVVPPQSKRCECSIDLIAETSVVDLLDGALRYLRVHIQGNAESRGGLEHW